MLFFGTGRESPCCDQHGAGFSCSTSDLCVCNRCWAARRQISGHRDEEPTAPRGCRASGTRLTRSGRREMCTLPEPCNLSDLPCCPGLIPAAPAGNRPAFGADPEPPGSWRGSRCEGELPRLCRKTVAAAVAKHRHYTAVGKLCRARETHLPQTSPAWLRIAAAGTCPPCREQGGPGEGPPGAVGAAALCSLGEHSTNQPPSPCGYSPSVLGGGIFSQPRLRALKAV